MLFIVVKRDWLANLLDDGWHFNNRVDDLWLYLLAYRAVYDSLQIALTDKFIAIYELKYVAPF